MINGIGSGSVFPTINALHAAGTPALSLNFLGEGTLDPRITFSRADTAPAATRVNSAGLIETVPVNYATNSDWALGTVDGSPGTNPTNWNVGGAPTGCTKTLAHGTDANGKYLEVTYAGTNTSGSTQYPTISHLYSLTASGIGVQWCISFRAIFLSGTLPTGFDIKLDEFNSGGSVLASTTASIKTQLSGNSLATLSAVRTTNQATVAYVSGGLFFTVANNEAFNVVFRLYEPQLEKGAARSTYIPTTSAASGAPRFDYDPASVIYGPSSTELLINPGFDSDTDWIHNNGNGSTVISNGSLRIITPDSVYASVTQASVMTVGKTYRLTAYVSESTGGGVAFAWGGGQRALGVGLTSIDITPTALANIEVKRSGSATDTTIDYVSLREIIPLNSATPRGLLIEEARTNILTYSNDLSSATGAWTPTLGTAVISGTAPDGTATATLFTPSAGTAQHYVSRSTPAISTATTYSFSVFAKSNGKNIFSIYCASMPSTGAAWFTLAGAGGVSNLSAGVTATIQAFPNGWYLCTYTGTTISTTTVIELHTGSTLGNFSDVANGTDGVYLWGAQFETTAANGAAPFSTSLIPTTTAAVTRAADVASMTGTNFSSWYNNTEGSLCATVDTHTVQSQASRVVVIDGGSAVDAYTLLRATSSPSLRAVLTLNSSSQYDNDAASGSFTITGTTNKFSAAISSGTTADVFCGNGGAIFTTAAKGVSPATRTMTTMFIGSNRAATSFLNGHIQRLTYFNKRLPDTTLQVLSS